MPRPEQLRMLGDRVLVRVDEPSRVSEGGVVIPDQVHLPVRSGTVVSVGPGRINGKGVRVLPPVQPGDRVVFSRFTGEPLDLEGVPHCVLDGKEVLAVDGDQPAEAGSR